MTRYLGDMWTRRRRVYKVIAEPRGTEWLITVPAVSGVSGQARVLGDALTATRAAIAQSLGVGPEDFELSLVMRAA